MADPRNDDGLRRIEHLFPAGLVPEWGASSDPSTGGLLHRLLVFLVDVAHAHLIHDRVIDEQSAAAFRQVMREQTVSNASHLLATLLAARKVRASDLLGIVPADSSRARALTLEMRDLLRAVRIDRETAPDPSDGRSRASEVGPLETSAELLFHFLVANFECDVIVAGAAAGPIALAAAARPGPQPDSGPTAYLLRRDGSRVPLHPFVVPEGTDGGLAMLWDLERGRIRYARTDDGALHERPLAAQPDFAMEFLLKMGGYGEVREWLKAMSAEQRADLDKRNVLYAGFCHYGSLYLRQREFQQAAVELEKAVKLRPDLVLAHLYLAQAFMSVKQLDRAIEVLKKHAVLFNRSDRIFELIGDCYRQKKDLVTALRMYEKAAGLNPDSVQAEKKRDSVRDEVRRDRDDKQQQQQQGPGGGGGAVRLEDFLVDMTTEAEVGMYQETVGRDDELRQLVEILACRDKRNPLLLGDPGVGKTALVEDFVLRLVQRRLPPRFAGKKVYLMSVATLLAGAKFRGQFEERVLDLVKMLKAQDCILFIDNFHNIVNAGLTRGGTLDTSNIIKPYLMKGELQVIGATTHEEFRQNVEKDVSLLRCFQTLVIEEPSVETAADMVCHVRGRYEVHHRIVLPEAIVRGTIGLIDRSVRERALPDKAIDVFDRACAVAAIRRAERNEAAGLPPHERDALREAGAPASASLSSAAVDETGLGPADEPALELGTEDVLAVLSEMTRIPLARLTEDGKSKVARMEELLSERVIGQTEAVGRVSRVLRAARMHLTLDERRPKGVFLFVGPTGVGKTELARAMAEMLFGSDDRMIRIDMSEYMERINQSRLIGTAPGYVGYNDQNQLTDEVRKNPHSLVLLDEIEKADHNMLNLFLQVFDAGRLTDGKGRTIHFDNTTVVMTSNVGTHLFSRAAVGFEEGRGSRHSNATSSDLLREVKRHFPPEFLNRIDEIICFDPLAIDDVRSIARQKVGHLVERLERGGHALELTPEAEELLAKEGYSFDEGARNLERTIRRLLLEPLAARSLDPAWETTTVVRVGSSGTELTFELVAPDEGSSDVDDTREMDAPAAETAGLGDDLPMEDEELEDV